MILDQWQEEVLKHDGNILLCTGRQNGKTTIIARKSAEYLVAHPHSQIIIVSLTEDQAKLIIVMILDYLEKHPEYKKLISKGREKPTQNRIVLKNKARVIARPVGNTGDAVRGFTGDVLVIDEASRMPELAFEAAKPTLFTTGGQIWMCSTPFGKKGYFWETYNDNVGKENGHFRVWNINSEDVANNRQISEDWTEEHKKKALAFLETEKRVKSKNYYGQEYLALFLDDLRQLFDDKLIAKCQNLKRRPANPEGYYIMGCDLARMGGDKTTIEVFELRNGRAKQVENLSFDYLDTYENEQLIKQYAKLWNVEKIGIDAGSGTLGVSIYDYLRRDPELKNKIIPMNNREVVIDRKNKSQRLKQQDFYDNLKGMMERGEIDLLDDEDLRLSLKSVQFEVISEQDSQSKVKIFSNPHTQSHIVEGIIRAAYIAKFEKNINIEIHWV